MEYSKIGLEHFTPDYTRYFRGLPEGTRDALYPAQWQLYKGISAETIAEIYDLLYERSVAGSRPPVTLSPNIAVRAAEPRGEGFRLTVRRGAAGARARRRHRRGRARHRVPGAAAGRCSTRSQTGPHRSSGPAPGGRRLPRRDQPRHRRRAVRAERRAAHPRRRHTRPRPRCLAGGDDPQRSRRAQGVPVARAHRFTVLRRRLWRWTPTPRPAPSSPAYRWDRTRAAPSVAPRSLAGRPLRGAARPPSHGRDPAPGRPGLPGGVTYALPRPAGSCSTAGGSTEGSSYQRRGPRPASSQPDDPRPAAARPAQGPPGCPRHTAAHLLKELRATQVRRLPHLAAGGPARPSRWSWSHPSDRGRDGQAPLDRPQQGPPRLRLQRLPAPRPRAAEPGCGSTGWPPRAPASPSSRPVPGLAHDRCCGRQARPGHHGERSRRPPLAPPTGGRPTAGYPLDPGPRLAVTARRRPAVRPAALAAGRPGRPRPGARTVPAQQIDPDPDQRQRPPSATTSSCP